MNNVKRFFSSYKPFDALLICTSLILTAISYLIILLYGAKNLSLIVQAFPAAATASVLSSFYSRSYTIALIVRLLFCAAQIYAVIVIFQRVS